MTEFRKTYKLSEINIKIIKNSVKNETYILFQPIMETQFYSPGVNKINKINNEIAFEFVRAKISEEKPNVDINSEYVHKWIFNNKLHSAIKNEIEKYTSPTWQIFSVSGQIKHFYVIDSNGESIFEPSDN